MRSDTVTTIAIVTTLVIIIFFTMVILLGGKHKQSENVVVNSKLFILRDLSTGQNFVGQESGSSIPSGGVIRMTYCDLPQAFDPVVVNQTRLRKRTLTYKQETEKLSDNPAVGMDDPELLSLIRNYWITNPNTKIYRFRRELVDYSGGISPIVDSLLGYKENGVYVDVGASDGESQSKSLFFKKYRRWNGILLEADSLKFRRLIMKNRQGLTLNACITPYKYPSVVNFTRDNKGRLVRSIDGAVDSRTKKKPVYRIQCFPFYSVMAAVGITHVDYLSLTSVGVEKQILISIPFNKINIDIITIEIEDNEDDSDDGEDLIVNLMREKNYTFLLQIRFPMSESYILLFRK